MKYLLLLLSFVCLSCCNYANNQENQNKSVSNEENTPSPPPHFQNKPEIINSDIPKASWEKIYFEGINERTDEAGLKSLRKTTLDKDDLEVRIWIGFGITTLEGFILRRIKDQWSAIYITGNYKSDKFINRNINLEEPKEGWNQTWQKLLNAEILNLPDAESINCNEGATDGFSYVLELKKGQNYRTYMYESPDMLISEKCKENIKIQNIIKIINQDYNIKNINEQQNSEK